MMSIGQRALLLASIPNVLGGVTVKKLRKDRLGNDDFVFPSMRIAIISEGILVRPSTGGPIRKFYDSYGDAQEYLGHHQRATVSVTILCESQTAGTDQETPEILDQLLYDLERNIEIWRLGISWARDYMKVVPGSCKITYLAPFQALASGEHWIYPGNIDFQVEYLFEDIDPTPNIHAIAYDFSLPMSEDSHIYHTRIDPPWYEMGISLCGWQSNILMDIILFKTYKSTSYGMDIILDL